MKYRKGFRKPVVHTTDNIHKQHVLTDRSLLSMLYTEENMTKNCVYTISCSCGKEYKHDPASRKCDGGGTSNNHNEERDLWKI